MVRKVEVVKHDPNWSKLFREQADKIAAILVKELVAIHHIGSTAIPRISAKPTIDILVEVHDIERIDTFNEEMTKMGYQPKGEFGIPGRRFFVKSDDSTRACHVHVFQTGNREVKRHLNFRDYMIAHPQEALVYGRLKEELAQVYPEDIESYTKGKDEYIKEIDRRAKAWKESSRQ